MITGSFSLDASGVDVKAINAAFLYQQERHLVWFFTFIHNASCSDLINIKKPKIGIQHYSPHTVAWQFF
jgi:hypothetical protein